MAVGRVWFPSVALALLAPLSTFGVVAEPAGPLCAFTFSDSAEGFVKVNAQTHSDVAWDATNGRVRVLADRRDVEAELFTRSLPGPLSPDTDFSFTARWRTTAQGHFQSAHPLLLAGADVVGGDPLAQANTFGFLYSSQNLGQSPSYDVWYRDAAGVRELNNRFVGQANTEYHLSAELKAGQLTLGIHDVNDVELFAASYTLGSNFDDGFQFDNLIVASGVGSLHGQEASIEAWVDDVGASFLADARPCPVRNLVASTGSGLGEISLAWAPPTNAEAAGTSGYRVYRAMAGAGPYELVGEVGNVVAFVDGGLPNGATRFYRVTGLGTDGEGALSNIAIATTIDLPTAPRNLSTRSGPGPGEVTLAWEPPESDGRSPVLAYGVFRASDDDGPFVLVGDVAAGLTFTDAGLPPATVQFYLVSARNLAGEGPASELGWGTTYIACVATVCVGAPLVEYNADVGYPSALPNFVPAHEVTIDEGLLKVKVFSDSADVLLLVPRLDGSPDLSSILPPITGTVTVTYTKLADQCVLGQCAWVISEPELVTTKVGELWDARFQVFVANVNVLDVPFVGLRLDPD